MIQQLIDAYRRANNFTRKIDCYSELSHAGEHTFHDAKACRECEGRGVKVCGGADDHHQVLKMTRPDGDFFVVHIEGALNQFNGYVCSFKGGVCDMAIYDKENIAFVELTCSATASIDAPSPKGKRVKARSQLANVISRLASAPENAELFSRLSSRTAVFAVRRKDTDSSELSPLQAKALAGMTTFQQPAPQRDPNLRQDLGYGFSLVEIVYPHTFVFPPNEK